MPTMMNAPLTDDEIDLIQRTSEMVTPGTAHPEISFDDVAQLCAQASEANRLRTALVEALEEWEAVENSRWYDRGSGEWADWLARTRIPELRKLVRP